VVRGRSEQSLRPFATSAVLNAAEAAGAFIALSRTLTASRRRPVVADLRLVFYTRNMIETFVARTEPIRFLIPDRDSKFTAAIDEVFRTDGIRTIRTPVRAPRANAFIERWIGTVCRECLDRILIVNRRHLERVLTV
jgi:transposase InsO family protein